MSGSLQTASSFKSLLGIINQQRRTSRREAARAKIIADRELIESLNQKTRDGQHPLEVFPNEIWAKVFLELKNPEDLQNVERSCPLFQELLEERRFRDFLAPIAFQVKKIQDIVGFGGTTGIPESLRRVCKTWREKIDELVNSNVELNDETYCFYMSLESPMLLCYPMEMIDKSRLSSFLERFPIREGVQSAFPFKFRVQVWFTRAISIIQEEEMDEFDEYFVKFLKCVGNQFYSFQVGIVNNETSIMAFYQLLQKWVSFMPQLSVLMISDSVDDPPPVDMREAPSEDITVLPFPQLMNLKELDVTVNPCPLFGNLIREILKSNSHLEKLCLDGHCYNLNNGAIEAIHSLPLKSLNVYPKEYSDPCIDWSFEKLVNKHWNLFEIDLCNICTVDHNFPENIKPVSISKIFSLLEQFKTLERVRLSFHEDVEEEPEDATLSLPSLKHFEFYSRSRVPLTFTISISPFLTETNPMRLMCTLNNVRHMDEGYVLRYSVKLKPGHVCVKDPWQRIEFDERTDLEDVHLMTFRGSESEMIPSIIVHQNRRNVAWTLKNVCILL